MRRIPCADYRTLTPDFFGSRLPFAATRALSSTRITMIMLCCYPDRDALRCCPINF
jgi:hypothetical protein